MLVKRIVLSFLLVICLSFPAAADEIVLNSGARYKGQLLNESLKLKTAYAEFSLDSDFMLKIEQTEAHFNFNLQQNNRYQAQILSKLEFESRDQSFSFKPEELQSLSLSSTNNYSSQSDLTLTTINEDFFSADIVDENIRIQTELGSALKLSLKDIISIERLQENLFRFELKDGRSLEAGFAQESIIIWPTAAELIKFDLDYLKRINLNDSRN